MSNKKQETAEQILSRYFGGYIGGTKIYLTDKDLLIKCMNEFKSKLTPPSVDPKELELALEYGRDMAKRRDYWKAKYEQAPSVDGELEKAFMTGYRVCQAGENADFKQYLKSLGREGSAPQESKGQTLTTCNGVIANNGVCLKCGHLAQTSSAQCIRLVESAPQEPKQDTFTFDEDSGYWFNQDHTKIQSHPTSNNWAIKLKNLFYNAKVNAVNNKQYELGAMIREIELHLFPNPAEESEPKQPSEEGKLKYSKCPNCEAFISRRGSEGEGAKEG